MRRLPVLLAAAAVLAGCGGSASYNRAAYRSCLDQASGVASTITVTHRRYADIAAHMPGAFGVVFNSGEVAVVFVGSDGAGTSKVAAWVRGHPGSKPRTVLRSGNLLTVLAERHPTVGVVKTLDGCRKSAAKT